MVGIALCCYRSVRGALMGILALWCRVARDGRGDTFWGTSYLKAHPLGNCCPEGGSPTYTRTVGKIRTRALGDPSDLKARVVPLYRGGL
ncbi:hypothetical protein E2C01_065204 [Portunus trituberculatus]|uniref:Uncharacterized protein n=1 Tax=Portunus trituberculatus TaxID=210409 RepID=A0A5B7HMD4_PORTR|nr:hypothetical protein [Portunus trituberculatus]